MKKQLYFILMLIMITTLQSSAQTWQWANSADGASGNSIKTDAAGNSYVTGSFVDTVLFGTTTLISSGMRDIFIIKYNNAGGVVWAKKAGGAKNDAGMGIGIDSSGNVYIGGYFGDDNSVIAGVTCTFGSATLVSYGGSDIFLAKYDAGGNFAWSRKAGSPSDDHCYDMCTDATGNCYLTGPFAFNPIGQWANYAYFNNDTLISNSYEDGFVAKYNSSGGVEWLQQAEGDGGQVRPLKITCDENGNAFIGGNYFDGALFGAFSLTVLSFSSANAFAAKCNASGWQWANQAAGDNTVSGDGIGNDAYGNTYLSGDFFDYTEIGNYQLTPFGYSDMFFAKYDSVGVLQWVKQLSGSGGNGTISGSSIAATINGNILVGGYFNDTIYFSSDTLISTGGNDIFILRFDTAGNVLWYSVEGGMNNQYCRGMAADNSGAIYITGNFTNSATIGPFTLTGSYFVAKYGQINVGFPENNSSLCKMNIFPNPFSSFSTISFSLPLPMAIGTGNVSLQIFDMNGRLVTTLANIELNEGQHQFQFNSENLDAGIYILKFNTENYSETKKLSVVR